MIALFRRPRATRRTTEGARGTSPVDQWSEQGSTRRSSPKGGKPRCAKGVPGALDAGPAAIAGTHNVRRGPGWNSWDTQRRNRSPHPFRRITKEGGGAILRGFCHHHRTVIHFQHRQPFHSTALQFQPRPPLLRHYPVQCTPQISTHANHHGTPGHSASSRSFRRRCYSLFRRASPMRVADRRLRRFAERVQVELPLGAANVRLVEQDQCACHSSPPTFLRGARPQRVATFDVDVIPLVEPGASCHAALPVSAFIPLSKDDVSCQSFCHRPFAGQDQCELPPAAVGVISLINVTMSCRSRCQRPFAGLVRVSRLRSGQPELG